jgi:hypothetical protein
MGDRATARRVQRQDPRPVHGPQAPVSHVRRDDAALVAGLQKAADWLTDRKVLPDQVTVADYPRRRV